VWEEEEYLGRRIFMTGFIKYQTIYFGHHLTETKFLI